MNASKGAAMKWLVLALSAAGLALAGFAAQEILGDAGGAKSAGPVPSAVSLQARPGGTSKDALGNNEISVRALPGAPKVDYVIDLNDGEPTGLPDEILRTLGTSDERGLLPVWAPRYAATRDGSQLAYVGTGVEGNLQIFVAGIDGSGVRQVTHDSRGATSPAWSPDASKIGYRGSGGLFVLDVATGESTPLPTASRVDRWEGIQFTPDGSSLLYTRSGEVAAELRTVPIDGGKSRVFIGRDQGFEVGNGSLSPDGSLVTMMGNEVAGPGAVRFVANADGTEHRKIAGRGSNPAGTWSPNGTRIVCAGSDDVSDRAVIVVDVATGGISSVAEGNGAIWLDDHTLLVEVS